MAEPRKSTKENKVAKTSKSTQASKPVASTKPAASTDAKKSRSKMPKFLRAAGGYFKGSWEELRYTKWPNRRSSLSLTLAVIVFSTLIMLFIVAVDYVFNNLFERIIS